MCAKSSIRLVLLLSFIIGSFLQSSYLSADPSSKTIGISQIVEHPALDAVRAGLLKSLKHQGFEEGKNLTVLYENAQGNVVTSTQIASKLLGSSADVLVGISTPSAQTLLSAAKRQSKSIPIVFAAVSDPLAAKLDLAQANYPITGITDAPNVKKMLEVMKEIIPTLKTVGFIYNSSEANSVSTISAFKQLLTAQKIEFQEATVNKTGDLIQAMESLMGKVDAVYFPQDNTVVSGVEILVKTAGNTPLFCSDPLLVDRGITAAVGYNYFEIGQETGNSIAKLLKGVNIQEIPIKSPDKLETIINKAMVQKLGLHHTNEKPKLKTH